ncbi:MAG: glycosyltransferase family protein [Gammaproteobacteria bacterium]|nr:glycosyltransferase family protein [Gammaproteobacteria bacterium]
MHILYGVQTTGHGHLVRSTPIIRQLRELGHQVDVVLSGPPPDPRWLTRIAAPLTTRPGLTFVADGGRIRYVRTALRARPLRFIRDVFRNLRPPPDLVVTDYEPITAWMARRRGLRSVGIGHLYAFAWPQVPRARGNLITRSVLDLFAPASIPAGAHWDAFGAPVLPPTVDPEIRALARGPVETNLIVVYLGFEPLSRLVPLLKQFPQHRFHVYAKVAAEWQDRNVAVRPISRPRFVADLARCAGVIANAGFTLTSECLHLGIAVLVKPIDGHLEQESNALALERLGLGTVTRRLSRNDLLAWLEQPAPTARHYPDVTTGLVQWLDAGAEESLSALSGRLWAAERR